MHRQVSEVRHRALLLFGFADGFRHSELVSLNLGAREGAIEASSGEIILRFARQSVTPRV